MITKNNGLIEVQRSIENHAPSPCTDSEHLLARLKFLENQNTQLELNEQSLNNSVAQQRIVIAELEGRSKELQALVNEEKRIDSRYRELFNLAPVGYLSLTEDGIINKVNLAGTCLLRSTSFKLIDTPFSDYLCNEDKEIFQKHLKSVASSYLSLQRQVTLKCQDLSQRTVLLATSVIRANKSDGMHFQIMIIDIEQQLNTEMLLRKANNYLDELAHHDSLTKLPNRTMFTDLLQSLIEKRSDDESKIGVVFFDLDGFKPINDTLGHHAGDKVLCEIAKRVKEHLRSSDTVARIGGDEFTIILDDTLSAKDAIARAESIAEVIRAPIAISEGTVSVTSSMGLSLYPDHALSVEDLVKGADAAMYQAKQAGRDQLKLYSRESQETIAFLSELETSLPSALINDELRLQFQPVYNATSLSISSLEALLRWQHPTLGVIEPDEFIPLAEKSDRIVEIGKWVLEAACKQARLWSNEGIDVPIAINVSTRQLLEPGFSELIKSTLRRYQLPESSLEIEITESALISDHQRCLDTLQKIREAGHVVTLDDFGIGHSSLARLVHLPVVQLKIDRLFINDIKHSPPMRKVVRNIVNMAHELDLFIVCEGVELPSQLDYLVSIGCDSIQGFVLSRPDVPQAITQLLRNQREALTEQDQDQPQVSLEHISS